MGLSLRRIKKALEGAYSKGLENFSEPFAFPPKLLPPTPLRPNRKGVELLEELIGAAVEVVGKVFPNHGLVREEALLLAKKGYLEGYEEVNAILSFLPEVVWEERLEEMKEGGLHVLIGVHYRGRAYYERMGMGSLPEGARMEGDSERERVARWLMEHPYRKGEESESRQKAGLNAFVGLFLLFHSMSPSGDGVVEALLTLSLFPAAGFLHRYAYTLWAMEMAGVGRSEVGERRENKGSGNTDALQQSLNGP